LQYQYTIPLAPRARVSICRLLSVPLKKSFNEFFS
jgi:hypothetical protein